MSKDRDASGHVCAEAIATVGIEGRVLLAGAHAGLEQEITDLGGTPVVWNRFAFDGASATAWPEPGPYDAVVMELPQGKEATRCVLQGITHRMSPTGHIWVHGHNDSGIKSAGKVLEERFGTVEVMLSKRHCRIWRGTNLLEVPEAPVPERVTASVGGVDLDWLSWPGLFAHGRLDPATEALLQHLPVFEGKVLDFGCGAGVIAQFIARRDGLPVDLSDVDALAIDVAKVNVPQAGNVVLCEGLPADTGRYRAIVSNPPLHRGVDLAPGPMDDLIQTAGRRLGRSGELWITTQGAVPLQARLQEKFNVVQLVHRDRRFTVWRAKK